MGERVSLTCIVYLSVAAHFIVKAPMLSFAYCWDIRQPRNEKYFSNPLFSHSVLFSEAGCHRVSFCVVGKHRTCGIFHPTAICLQRLKPFQWNTSSSILRCCSSSAFLAILDLQSGE